MPGAGSPGPAPISSAFGSLFRHPPSYSAPVPCSFLAPCPWQPWCWLPIPLLPARRPLGAARAPALTHPSSYPPSLSSGGLEEGVTLFPAPRNGGKAWRRELLSRAAWKRGWHLLGFTEPRSFRARLEKGNFSPWWPGQPGMSGKIRRRALQMLGIPFCHDGRQ